LNFSGLDLTEKSCTQQTKGKNTLYYNFATRYFILTIIIGCEVIQTITKILAS